MAYNPAVRRASYLKNKEKAIRYSTIYNRERKLGIKNEEYEGRLLAQNNVCAICKNTCTKALAADHDHLTGKIRGLLCNSCNRGLGFFKDEISRLESAIVYLTKGGHCGS